MILLTKEQLQRDYVSKEDVRLSFKIIRDSSRSYFVCHKIDEEMERLGIREKNDG